MPTATLDTTSPQSVADPGKELLAKYEAAEDPESHPVSEPEPVVTSPPPPPPAAKHPGWLAREAKAAGLDDADLADMTREEVERALDRRSRDRKETSHADAVARNTAGRPYDPATGRLLPAESAPEPDKPFDLKTALNVDPTKWNEVDEEGRPKTTMEQVIADVAKPLWEEIQRLKGAHAEYDRREQHRQATAHFDRLDQMFADREDVFGKGSRSKLAKGSPELARRVAVITAMESARQADPNQSIEDNFDRTVTALFGGRPEPETPDPKNFAQARTLPPTARNGVKEPKGTKTAERAVEAILKDRALSDPRTEAEELPD